MGITQDNFKKALSCFASGVTVVTMKSNDDALHGITVSAFSSVSLEPPLILICLDKQTVCYKVLEERGRFVVNILKEDQKHISHRFATPIPNKFDGIEYSLNSDGLPIVQGALVNLECEVRNTFDAGDHSIFLAEVQNLTSSEGKALVYCQGEYRMLSGDVEAK